MILREKFNKIKEKNNDEELKKFHSKYKHLFQMPAKTLTNQVMKVFKEKDETLKVNPVHEVVGDYFEMQQRENKSNIYNETISTSVVIKKGNEIEKIVLIKNSTAKNGNSLCFGTYNVDIFDLLLNDSISYKDEIHEACWIAIAENLKNRLAEEVNSTTK